MATTWIRKLFGIPQDQNLVWWLIGKQNNFKSQVLGLIGFVGIFWFAFGSPLGALAMILAMYLHELGHYLVFVNNHIKSVILLLFPLGAVAAPANKEENARSDLLPWWNIAILLQAGPTMNVLQMVVGLGMIYTNTLPQLGHQMVFINGILVLFNMLPLINMDGGQLFHVIYSSLKEQYDVIVALISTIFVALIVGGLLLTPIGQGALGMLRALFQNAGLIFFLLFLTAGIWHKQGKDDPLHSKSAQAMTTRQVFYQLAYYICLVLLTFFIMAL